MDYSSNDMTQSLTVEGNVLINGTLSLSESSGGDLDIKGNFELGGSGTFNHRNRAVTFSGTSAQTITEPTLLI